LRAFACTCPRHVRNSSEGIFAASRSRGITDAADTLQVAVEVEETGLRHGVGFVGVRLLGFCLGAGKPANSPGRLCQTGH
jgi:hypothetical protein